MNGKVWLTVEEWLTVKVYKFSMCVRPSASSIILVSMFNQEEAAINFPVKMTRVLKLVLTS